MTRVAMIGMGGMGGSHANILSKMKNVEIVGVCDLIEQKAKNCGEKLGVKWCLDFHELLDDAEAVWVCTEPFNRLKVVTACAEAGKHIFTEKPICNDLKDADEMLAAAREAGVKYMLGYCLRFWHPYKLIHDTFVRGELGKLVNCWTRRYMSWDPSKVWYGDQKKSGGVMLDFGSHDIDWLRWVGGDVKTVFGQTVNVRKTMTADDHGQCLMLFEKGGMGTADDSWLSTLGTSSVGVVGTKGVIIVGDDGKVHKKLEGGEEQIVEAETTMAIDPSGKLDEDKTVAKANETIQEHFFRCIEQDIEPTTPATDGRKTLATVCALKESSRTGKSVDLASFD